MSDAWTAGRVRRALVRHLHWYQTLVVPEFELDGARCDLVQISRSDYATEFEIKVSASDWRADEGKGKWQTVRPHVSRFFYVVPGGWRDDAVKPAFAVPEFVRPTDGILVAHGSGNHPDGISEFRAAKRLRATKVSADDRRRALDAFYYRYWRHESNMERVRFELNEARKTCPNCFSRMRCSVCDSTKLARAA